MRGVIDVFVGQVKRDDLAAVCVKTNCNLRQARRFAVPCFSNNHSPAPRSFSPCCQRSSAGRPKRPRDLNQWAKRMVDIALAEPDQRAVAAAADPARTVLAAAIRGG